MKRTYIPLQKALKEAKENNSQLTKQDGICACYDIENMGYCKDEKSRWYHFTSVNGIPAYTIKR